MVAGPSAAIALSISDQTSSTQLESDLNCCQNSPHRRIYRIARATISGIFAACMSYATIHNIEQALAQEGREDAYQYIHLGVFCGVNALVGLGASCLFSHDVYEDCQAPTQHTHLAHLSVQEDDFRYQRDDEKV